MDLQKMAINFCDGVIVNSKNAPEELITYAREEAKLPVMGLPKDEEYTEACSKFYDEVWGE